MKTIDEIILQDSQWRKLAESICGDYDQAQDLVQEMYIKLMSYESINNALVGITLKNLWLDSFKYKKTRNTYSIDSQGFSGNLVSYESSFEVEDHQLGYVDRFYELPMRQQELILESYDFSIRQIADKFSINRMYVHRQIHKGLKYVLQDDYEMYSSSYTKHLLISNK